MVLDIQPGSPVADVDGAYSTLDIGLSATVNGRPMAQYLGQVVPRSGSSSAARRPMLRFFVVAPFPATLADGRPITVLPTALVEV